MRDHLRFRTDESDGPSRDEHRRVAASRPSCRTHPTIELQAFECRKLQQNLVPMLFHQKTLVLLAFEVFRVDTAANYNLVAIVDLLATIMKGIDERKHVHEQVFFWDDWA